MKNDIVLDEESKVSALVESGYFYNPDEVKNTSGLRPFGTNVLLKIKLEPKEIKTKSGLIVATEAGSQDNVTSGWEARQMSVVFAQVIQCGSQAYYDQGDDAPQPGDYVLIKRYSGSFVTGIDGAGYRIVKDIEAYTKADPFDYEVIG